MRLFAFMRGSLLPDSLIGRRLALAALINSLGTGMFLTGSAIYFTRVVGLSPARVGVGLSIAGLAGLLGSVPIGVLGDRIGPGRVYVALQLLRAAGYVAYTLISGFPGFAVVAAMIEICDAAAPAIAQAVVIRAVGPEQQVATQAKVRAVRNLGFGLGAAVAAGVLASGSHLAFRAMIIANVVVILLGMLLLYRAGVMRMRTAEAVSQPFQMAHNSRYVAAALLNGVLSVHMTLLFTGLPLWLATRTRVPVALIGGLVVLNTAMPVRRTLAVCRRLVDLLRTRTSGTAGTVPGHVPVGRRTPGNDRADRRGRPGVPVHVRVVRLRVRHSGGRAAGPAHSHQAHSKELYRYD